MLGELTSGVFGLLVLIGIFWVCRELFCWYWKFSRMVELAENQRAELAAIKGLLRQLVDQGRGLGKADSAATPE